MRVRIRKWGNSYGVLLPKKEIRKRGLRENQIIEIDPAPVPDIRDLFGKYPLARPLQEIKDELRKGHEEGVLL